MENPFANERCFAANCDTVPTVEIRKFWRNDGTGPTIEGRDVVYMLHHCNVHGADAQKVFSLSKTAL